MPEPLKLLTEHPPGSLEATLVKMGAVEKAALRMMEGLDAEMRDGFPDHKQRLESAKAIMDRVDGRCIERQLIQHQHIKAAPALDTLLSDSGVRAKLLERIKAMDGETDAAIVSESRPAKKGNA